MNMLPERRLLIRTGGTLLTLDLTQVREVGGEPGSADLPLSALLGLTPAGAAAAAMVLETGKAPVTVSVEAVGGVREIAAGQVHAVGPHVLMRFPGLVRAVMRVQVPATWRGGSLLPMPAVSLVSSPDTAETSLAADLEPTRLGALLLQHGGEPP